MSEYQPAALRSVRAAAPPKTAQLHSASGGSAAAKAASVGAHLRAAGPRKTAQLHSASRGSAAAVAASVGAQQ
jgi:hypothetical protein